MPASPEALDWSLLVRYLTGELTPAEAAAVERWFSADPAHRALLDELRSVWASTAGDVTGWDGDRAIRALHKRVQQLGERAGQRSGARPVPSFVVAHRRPWMAIAASMVLTVGAGLLVHSMRPVDPPAAVTAPASTDVTTRRGQQAEIRLADGSRVILSAASTLTYASDFGARDRTVTLEGEAYFNVVHDVARPFRVESAHGVAEDLGTAFVVRARGSSALQVVVTDGAVVLRARAAGATDSLVLTRGQLGRVAPDGGLTFRSRVDTTGYLAWASGRLVFNDTPLAEVAAELSRWYDADVRVAEAGLASRRFTGRFERKTLDEAVRLVAAVSDVSVRRTETGWLFR